MKTIPLLLALSGIFCAFAAARVQTERDQSSHSATLTANPIYRKNCAKCHGKTAEGRHFGGPSLLSDKTAAAATNDIRGIITHGKGRMPKFDGKLAATDIDALVEQIKAPKAK